MIDATDIDVITPARETLYFGDGYVLRILPPRKPYVSFVIVPVEHEQPTTGGDRRQRSST